MLSVLLMMAAASKPEHSVREISEFAMQSLSLVAAFDEALAARDEAAMRKLATDKLQIEPLLGRLLDENKALSFRDLYEFQSRCIQTGRLSTNHVAITVHYDCSGKMQGRMVFNFEGGKISRVAVGELPIADEVRVYPKDRTK